MIAITTKSSISVNPRPRGRPTTRRKNMERPRTRKETGHRWLARDRNPLRRTHGKTEKSQFGVTDLQAGSRRRIRQTPVVHLDHPPYTWSRIVVPNTQVIMVHS